ncbi:MAG: amidohydrolase family protein [Vampirovibrionales bacterium]|nr:amidohydrolase family protein [Vampirovibrionales bacterium]
MTLSPVNQRLAPTPLAPLTVINAPQLLWPQMDATGQQMIGFKAGPGWVVIQHGRILDVTKSSPASLLLNHDNVSLITLPQGTVLTPGLIDLQLNGAFGVSFNNASLKQVAQVLWHLPQNGVTRFMPTLISAPVTDLMCSLQLLEEAASLSHDATMLDTPAACSRPAEMIGIHLEGPFLNPRFSGIHPAEAMPAQILEPELKALLWPRVKMMTLAPERDESCKTIEQLVAANVVPMAGHCNPTPETLQRAIHAGLKGVTHLFNAMAPFHHRSPGLIPDVLMNDELFCSVIADGEHIAQNAYKLLAHCKPAQKTFLVSDAMALAGMRIGDTATFGGQHITRVGNRAVNGAGQLAGSVLMLNEIIALGVRNGWFSFAQAVFQASAVPAALMKTADTANRAEFGALAPGMLADMLVWQAPSAPGELFEIMGVWQQGEPSFIAPNCTFANMLRPQVSQADENYATDATTTETAETVGAA